MKAELKPSDENIFEKKDADAAFIMIPNLRASGIKSGFTQELVSESVMEAEALRARFPD